MLIHHIVIGVLLDSSPVCPVLVAVDLPRAQFLEVVRATRVHLYCRKDLASRLDEIRAWQNLHLLRDLAAVSRDAPGH